MRVLHSVEMMTLICTHCDKQSEEQLSFLHMPERAAVMCLSLQGGLHIIRQSGVDQQQT